MSSNSPTEPILAPSKGRRLLVRTAFVCAVLATLLVAFYLVEKVRGQAAWKRYQNDARSRGVKLTLLEYVPAPVPDERNFAAVPIFQDAFRKPQPPNPLRFPGEGERKLPSFGAVLKAQTINLAEWQKFFVETKVLPAAGESAAADVLKALESYAPQFEQLRLAGARPESRFPVRYEDGAAAALPHVSLFQSAAKLYALRLSAHLALGDSAAAYKDFRSGLRLYTALQTEPTLIAGLVRLSVLAIAENTVWSGLVQRQWGAAELEKITADLTQVRLMDDYALGLGSERGFSNLIHDQLLQKGASEVASLMAFSEGGASVPSKPVATALVGLYPTGWVRLSQTRANHYFDEMLARVTQEPPRILTDRAVPSLPMPMDKVGTIERVRYLLFFLMTPSLNELERTYGYGQTLLDETRLGCALERHRLAHGGFPASLDALAPSFIPAVPRDVMNGEPLHYRSTGDGGYILYSVAWNLTDDGGQTDPKVHQKQQPDWVWSIPGK
jgi:hypothetical protein